ncbi:MAG: hypothetical protein IJW33_01685, partial [Lentisphaeria bacterium]|nr:hypothetical protein [Lentisphaeria bacterium]
MKNKFFCSSFFFLLCSFLPLQKWDYSLFGGCLRFAQARRASPSVESLQVCFFCPVPRVIFDKKQATALENKFSRCSFFFLSFLFLRCKKKDYSLSRGC